VPRPDDAVELCLTQSQQGNCYGWGKLVQYKDKVIAYSLGFSLQASVAADAPHHNPFASPDSRYSSTCFIETSPNLG